MALLKRITRQVPDSATTWVASHVQGPTGEFVRLVEIDGDGNALTFLGFPFSELGNVLSVLRDLDGDGPIGIDDPLAKLFEPRVEAYGALGADNGKAPPMPFKLEADQDSQPQGWPVEGPES